MYQQKLADEALHKEAKRKEKLAMKLPNRDNLRFKALAQYKQLRDGDVLGFELIDKRLTSKPSIKGIALSSPSIEEYEKFKVHKMYEGDEI